MSPRLSDTLLRAQTDERLAVLAVHGHERAFGVLVERYRAQLVRAADRLVGTERAEDVVQQTLLRAWSAIQAGTSVSHVSGWLHQILRNTAFTERTRGRLHEQLPADWADLHSSSAAAESRATLAVVLGEIQRLPEYQRSALLQTEFVGRSRRQVATDLGVSEGAVRQLVHRARNTLRLAVTAITPFPLAAWAARSHAGSALAYRLAELGGQTAAGAPGTPAAAGSALLGTGSVLKAGAAVLAAGALGGGLVIKALAPKRTHDRNVPSVLSRERSQPAASGAVAVVPRTRAPQGARTSSMTSLVGSQRLRPRGGADLPIIAPAHRIAIIGQPTWCARSQRRQSGAHFPDVCGYTARPALDTTPTHSQSSTSTDESTSTTSAPQSTASTSSPAVPNPETAASADQSTAGSSTGD